MSENNKKTIIDG